MVCLWSLMRLQFCLACMGQKAGRERSLGAPMATQEAAILLSLHGVHGWEGKIQCCAYGHSGGCNSA